MTTSPGHPTIEFGPWNKGIVRWRQQKREATTLRVEQFLTSHGSTRLCAGLVEYRSIIRFTCAKCQREIRCMWKDLMSRDRVWCRSCVTKERMVGKKPSQVMLDRAAEANRQGAARQRALRVVLPPKPVVLLRETTRAQVKRLSPKWLPTDWRKVMRTAVGAFQRCTNTKSPAYAYYGGRGITFGFASTAMMSDWILTNLGPPLEGQSLDRINTNGHYEPGNLRWATLAQQMKNRNSWRRGT